MQEVDKTKPSLVIKYKNWEGVVGIRHIIPTEIYYGHTEWHPEDGWLLKAWDMDKDAERQFAIKDIIQFYPPEE